MQSDSVVSPCVSICRLDAKGEICLGCLRSMDEIAAWPALTPDQRRAVLQNVATRTPPPPQAGITFPRRQDRP